MIKMIAGVYGLRVENGKDADGNPKYRVKGMGPNDGPFSVDAAEEARLVKLGIAEYVGDVTVPQDDDEPDLPDGVTAIPEYSTKNTKAELLEVAELCGITLDENMTKAQMVAALDAHIEANMVDGVDIDEDAAEDDDEPAPAFDASEAVQ